MLVVPRESVAEDGNRSVVWVIAGRSSVATAVTLGAIGDIDAVVTTGLKEGVTIARRPPSGERP